MSPEVRAKIPARNGSTLRHPGHHRDHQHCPPVPHFDRLCYFYGQLLGAADFRTEQAYFREKLKLHNRCLHGHGVVCGLEVKPAPWRGRPERPDSPDEKTDDQRPTDDDEAERQRRECREKIASLNERIAFLRDKAGSEDLTADERAALIRELEELIRQLGRIECECERIGREHPEDDPCGDDRKRCPAHLIICPGLALDCHGNELVVRQQICIDPLKHLSDRDRRALLDDDSNKEVSLFVHICFGELPLGPARPSLPEDCGVSQECHHGKVRDSVCIKVTLEPPDEDPCCDCCCGECCDDCILLARVDHFRPWRAIHPDHVHNEVRRHVATYVTTRIESINWVHGAAYSEHAVRDLIDLGLEIRFTRPVKRESLQRGVIETIIYEGGYTVSGQMIHLAGEIETDPLPEDPTCTRLVRYVFSGGRHERLSPSDRLHIIVRAPFIMDVCCRAVDGDHIGGWVRWIGQDEDDRIPRPDVWPPRPCAEEHGHMHRLVSGNGVSGGNFESWLFVNKPTE